MIEDERRRLYDLVHEIFRRADKEFRKPEQQGYDFAYWQGQKNLARVILAELAPDKETREGWESENVSAQGAIADETLVRAQLKEAMYLIGQAADGDIDRRCLPECKAWVWRYRALVNKGLADAAPDFIGWDV